MYFKNNNFELYYEKYGNKKQKIIILPGWGDTRKTFNTLIKNLVKNNTVYIFDYPGFGNSKILTKDLTIYDYANVINEFLKENKIYNPIIIGHSFGGRIIITLSGCYNTKFKKIILMSSAGIKPTKTKKQLLKQKIYKFLKLFSNLLPSKIKKSYLKILLNIFGSKDYKSIPEILQKTFKNIVNEDLTNYLNKINDKTLIIWGENDIDTPLLDGLKMKKLIRNSTIKIVKNTGHFFYLEKPVEVLAIINHYIEKKD